MASTIIPGITAPHPHPTSCGGFQLDGANVLAPTSPCSSRLTRAPTLTIDPGHSSYALALTLTHNSNPHPSPTLSLTQPTIPKVLAPPPSAQAPQLRIEQTGLTPTPTPTPTPNPNPNPNPNSNPNPELPTPIPTPTPIRDRGRLGPSVRAEQCSYRVGLTNNPETSPQVNGN